MDVLKQVAEALVMACGTFRSHAGEEQRAEECAAALAALRGLEWKPMAEMEAFEPQGVRIGYHGLVSWVMAPYIAYRRGEVTSIYTHFYRPILPTPPKREGK
jgi:hypothetical protein